MTIKFISYSGKYPNLCSGTLCIKKDGKKWELVGALTSGGHVWFDEGWGDHIETGAWEVRPENLPPELREDAKEIQDLVNENVEYGCCGGCV